MLRNRHRPLSSMAPTSSIVTVPRSCDYLILSGEARVAAPDPSTPKNGRNPLNDDAMAKNRQNVKGCGHVHEASWRCIER